MRREPDDWGFYHPESYVRTTFAIWVGSNFQVMPRPGGLDDQDPLWVADMVLCLELKAFQEQEQPDAIEEGFRGQDGRGPFN